MTDVARHAALDLTPGQFRALGHDLVERIATHLETLPDRPVTRGDTPAQVRALLGQAALADG
ncbi:MAG: aspartate aminotransferase family protein, partial [Gemmatimonadaceae bacterium]|nr:aspartate aminotransferase family protein [Gemmatimonadaceae bacterium]